MVPSCQVCTIGGIAIIGIGTSYLDVLLGTANFKPAFVPDVSGEGIILREMKRGNKIQNRDLLSVGC